VDKPGNRLFLDANVLFTAAHNPDGKAAFLFDKVTAGHWELISSRFAIEEARRNIAAKYAQCLERLDELIEKVTEVPQPVPHKALIDLPEKDQPIFLAAQAAQATHLLTGDLKHFGPHMNRPKKSSGIVIQTVADYLANAQNG
jgi:predicted nucleic acid-binding protein